MTTENDIAAAAQAEKKANFEKAMELLGIKPSPKYKHKPVDLGRDPDSELKATPIMREKCEDVCLNGENDIGGVIAHLVETHNEMVDKGAFNVQFEVYADGDNGYIRCSGDISETPEQVVDRLKSKVNVEKRRIEDIARNYYHLANFEKREKEIKAELDKAELALKQTKKERDAKKAKEDLEAAKARVAELEAKSEMNDSMESGKIS